MFTLTIKTDNAAFCDDDDEDNAAACRAEVARILRDAAKHIANGDDSRRLQDSNGNQVGEYILDIEEEDADS